MFATFEKHFQLLSPYKFKVFYRPSKGTKNSGFFHKDYLYIGFKSYKYQLPRA